MALCHPSSSYLTARELPANLDRDPCSTAWLTPGTVPAQN